MKPGIAFTVILLQAAAFFPAVGSAFGQTAGNDLDTYFQTVVSKNKHVGMGACLIKDGAITWEGYYGYSNLEEKKPLTRDTIFHLASLSKTMTATALMLVHEKGLFQLDDDVNGYLPFKVRNPNFPDTPITFRMLLTHRSGFADVGPASNKFGSLFHMGVRGDSPIPLSEFVPNVFTPGGKYYAAELFSTSEPGTKHEYSNIAYSLIGYLVERITGQDFAEFCKENIFTPLEMRDTGWHLSDLDTTRVIYTYIIAPADTLSYRTVRPFGLPGYPEGMLRTTTRDFANFLTMYMNRGPFKGRQVLKPETVDLLLHPQGLSNVPSRSFPVKDLGLTWIINDVDGEPLYAMNGFSGSIFANAYFSMKDKFAIIYYATGISMQNMAGMNDVTRKLRGAVR